MVYNYFDKNASCIGIKNELISNQLSLELATWQLAEELHKPIIRKFNKRKLRLPYIDNTWGTNLADMKLISTFNKEFFLLGAIDIFSTYARVIPLKDKKGITLTNAF